MTLPSRLRLCAAACSACCLAALADGVQAQLIYKCAQADGGVVYQDEPCPRGGVQLGTVARDLTPPNEAAMAQVHADWRELQRAEAARQEREAAVALAAYATQLSQAQAQADAAAYSYGSAYVAPVYYAPFFVPHAMRPHHLLPHGRDHQLHPRVHDHPTSNPLLGQLSPRPR